MRHVTLAAALIVACGVCAPVDADDWRIVEVRAVRVDSFAEPWAVAPPWLAPTNPGMDNAPSNLNDPPLNSCCRFGPSPCSQAPGTYPANTTIVANSYWSESIIGPTNWTVSFSNGVRTAQGQVIVFLNNEPITFYIPSSGNWNLCVALAGTIPGQAVSASPIQTGFAVTTMGGSLGPALYNSFNVVAGP